MRRFDAGRLILIGAVLSAANRGDDPRSQKK
jgi:hypothetical protein